jgi:hypothetical protein
LIGDRNKITPSINEGNEGPTTEGTCSLPSINEERTEDEPSDQFKINIKKRIGKRKYDQMEEEYTMEIIAVSSRALNKAERSYGITKLETLSIIFCLEKFRIYLLGRPFIILSDHAPLEYLLSEENDLLNHRLNTWYEKLMEFDFIIKYIPGHLNVLPDHL